MNKVLKPFIYPVNYVLRRGQTLKYLGGLEKTQWWSSTQLEELQNKKLRALINHCYENVPYYHHLFKVAQLRPEDIKSTGDLPKLPIITKEVMRKNFPHNITARNYSKWRHQVGSSSGTTGKPFQFFLDRNASIWAKASSLRCWKWAGYNLGDPYASLWVAQWGAHDISVYVRIQHWFHRIPFLSHFDINKELFLLHFDINNDLLGIWIEKLRQHRPKVIYGFTCTIYLLAKFMLDNGINDIRPNALVTSGTTLFESQRKLIESQFSCKVFDGYGGDGMCVAHECEEHLGYHLMVEGVVVEFLKDGEQVAPGEHGAIVLTNLNNYSMPFIRYNIEDVGKPSGSKCPCGRGLPLMESINGRIADIIITRSGRYIFPRYFLHILKHETDWINEWQIIQETKQKLRIKIVKRTDCTQERLDAIASSIQRDLGEDMDVRFGFVKSIPPSKSGKLRLTISKVPIKFT